jgi:hypothetical protein
LSPTIPKGELFFVGDAEFIAILHTNRTLCQDPSSLLTLEPLIPRQEELTWLPPDYEVGVLAFVLGSCMRVGKHFFSLILSCFYIFEFLDPEVVIECPMLV